MNFTFYICYGKNGGFRIEWTKRTKRIVLWKISFGLISRDMEVLMVRLFKRFEDMAALLKKENNASDN